MAMPNCSGGKLSARMACSVGCKPPPLSPWITRKKTSQPKVGASPLSAELIVNPATQAM